jgi:hypothetical protein
MFKFLFAAIPAAVLALTATTVQSAPPGKGAPRPNVSKPKMLTTQGKGPQQGVITRRIKEKYTASYVSHKVTRRATD